jgi:hypothetical protein
MMPELRQALEFTRERTARQPKIVALVLLAVAYGHGSLSIWIEEASKHIYMEAAKPAFDRVTASEISLVE